MDRFRLAGIAAIISAIFVLPTYLAGFALSDRRGEPLLTLCLLSLVIIGLLLSIVLLSGYWTLATGRKRPFLKRMTFLLFILLIVMTLFGVATIYAESAFLDLAAILLLVVTGVITLLFGVALRELRDDVPLAGPLGILYIVEGTLYATLLLALLVPFLAVAVSIVEAIMFFRLSARYGADAHQEARPDSIMRGNKEAALSPRKGTSTRKATSTGKTRKTKRA